MINALGSGTVNFKKGPAETLQKLANGIQSAIGHHECEAVWDYANLDRPVKLALDPEVDEDEDDDD